MLIRLSGADPEILRPFRAERGIYTGMATAIVSTGAIAGLSMWFAVHTVLGVGTAAAVLLAVGWSLIIMSLDRWLVISLKRHDGWKWWRYFLWASPRLFLAALFGIIISTPITMQIFNSEIKFQLTQMHRAALVAFDHGPLEQLNAQVAKDDKAVNNLASLSKSGGPALNPAQNPQVQFWAKQLRHDQVQEQRAHIQWFCQLYGHPPGSSSTCQRGSGASVQAAHQQYTHYRNQVIKDQGQVDAFTSQVNATSKRDQQAKEQQASFELHAAKDQLTADTRQLKTQVAAFNNTNKSNNGILDRIRALNATAGTDFGLNLARWLLFLFFMTIDCLPVLTKILYNIAPKGQYETALANDEEIQVQAAKHISQRRLEDEEARTWARAEAHRQLENEAVDAEKQLLRNEMARRAGGQQRLTARGQRGGFGWPRFRPPNGRTGAGGPTRLRTNIQQFDPSR